MQQSPAEPRAGPYCGSAFISATPPGNPVLPCAGCTHSRTSLRACAPLRHAAVPGLTNAPAMSCSVSLRGKPPVMAPLAISNVGGGQGHQNMQPYLTLSVCIALQGIFPSQN